MRDNRPKQRCPALRYDLLEYIAVLVMDSVASWAVFPPNWAGFDTKLRKILEFAGCSFLGYFLFKVAGFWAGIILSLIEQRLVVKSFVA